MIFAPAVLIRHARRRRQLIAYKDAMNEHRAAPVASAAGRLKSWATESRPLSRNAQKDYERYLALARAESQIGNTVAQRITTNTPNIIVGQYERTRTLHDGFRSSDSE